MPPEMPDVIGGETITSEWGNDIRDRTVQRYATVAARTAGHPSPVEGDLSYLQDVNRVEVFNGTAWTLLGPLGILGYTETTAFQAGISAAVDLTGLSVAVTVAASRRIRITGYINTLHVGAAGLETIAIHEAATQLTLTTQFAPSAGYYFLFHLAAVVSPGAGAHTYKLRAATSAGSITTQVAATQPAFILVEDIGPA